MKFTIIPLLVLLVCFVAPSYANTFDTYYEQGTTLFKSKDYIKAHEAFLNAFERSPGNWQVNFYLGRSAFETGSYELSVMAFERALIANPKAIRIKLELARAYQKLGVNELARKLCNEVLLTEPPDIVKRNIEIFLASIDKSEQRHSFKTTLTAGVDWNDNVWTSPTSSIINTAIGQVTLTGNSASKESDWILNTSVQADHIYSIPYKPMIWRTTATAYKSFYDTQSDLDLLYLDIDSGPQFVLDDKNIVGVSFIGDYIDIDNKTYQSSVGGKSFYRHILTPYLSMGANVQYKRKDYRQNDSKNANNFAFSFDTSYLVKNIWLNLSLAAEKEMADDDVFSYKQYETQLTLSREFPWDTTLFGNYNFTYTKYDDIAFLFTKEREDHIQTAGWGLKKRLWASPDKGKSLAFVLRYQYTHADSNIDLYEYRKNIIQTSLEYRF